MKSPIHARLLAVAFVTTLVLAWAPVVNRAPSTGPFDAFGPRAVAAQSVPRLIGQITDEAGVVADRRGDLERALASLLDRHGVQLYAAFVLSTGGDEPGAFARTTFEQNGLGGNDLLLLVAVDDRRYAWWENGALPSLSSTELDQLLSRTLEPRFREGDYPGGVADFAAALGDELGGAAEPTGTPVSGGGPIAPGPQPSPESPAGPSGFVVLGLVLVVAGAVVLWAGWRQRRLARLSAEERDRRTGLLAREANAALIAADDAVRDAGQELGFAEAQFDEPDVGPFRAAIAAAQVELKAAFIVRQQLDDEVPEDPETRERMLREIVERSRRVSGLVDEQRHRIQGLREQEETAPKVLATLPDRISALEARLPAAEQAVGRLQAYAAASWQPVQGNVEEARKRIAAAAGETARGTSALATTPPDLKAVARCARRADGALAEATTLLDAIDRLASTLDEARDRLDAEIRAADADLQAARAAVETAPADPTLPGRLADAEALLEGARRDAAGMAPDVLAARRDAQRANAAADEILAGIRQAEAQRARERAAIATALRSAEMRVARASDYIATRRPGVGREARTRLAEAERHLDEARALVDTEPPRAVAEAGLADRLADEAYQLARSDFDDWDGRGGRRRGDDLGIVLGGMILGNILGGLGRRGGGGWGGTPWGTPGGWGGRGGGGGWSRGGGRGGSGSW